MQLAYRNLEGREEKFNAKGDRNFHVVLTDEMAEALSRDGWNVKTKPPREEGDRAFHTIPVTLMYGRTSPRIVFITSNGRTPLDEELCSLVDDADISYVDITLRPYDWSVNGNTGRKAYLKSLMVVLYEDYLEQKYQHLPLLDINGNMVAPGRPQQTPALEGGYSPPAYDYDGEVLSESEDD